MNCKQGDLAIIVRTSYQTYSALGRIVKCMKLDVTKELIAWRIEHPIHLPNGRIVELCEDIALRPIRPSEGQDETLTWLDVPTKETA